MTRTSTGARFASSFSPSCSCMAANSDTPSPGPAVPVRPCRQRLIGRPLQIEVVRSGQTGLVDDEAPCHPAKIPDKVGQGTPFIDTFPLPTRVPQNPPGGIGGDVSPAVRARPCAAHSSPDGLIWGPSLPRFGRPPARRSASRAFRGAPQLEPIFQQTAKPQLHLLLDARRISGAFARMSHRSESIQDGRFAPGTISYRCVPYAFRIRLYSELFDTMICPPGWMRIEAFGSPDTLRLIDATSNVSRPANRLALAMFETGQLRGS